MNAHLASSAPLCAAVFAAALFASEPANAACFESGVDCTDDHNIPVPVLEQLSCDALWSVRNMIFDENGYCFQTAKALAVFSNEGCTYSSMASMPLNQYEIANIATIREVEKQKACY
jgi:YARHG domain